MYRLTWPRSCQKWHTLFKVSVPAQVWQVNKTGEIHQNKVVILHERGIVLKKTVILVIANRLQVCQWRYGDLKVPVCFFLTQVLHCNGGQKQKLSPLYCLVLLYYIWVISGRNANWSTSQRLILQNKQTFRPRIEPWLYCQKCSLKGTLEKISIWFN